MITFTVKPDGDDEYTVTAGSRDVLVWEKTNHGKTFLKLMSEMAMTDMYKIAHIVSRRLGLFTGDLKEFEASCELEFEEEEEPDPTPPVPSAGRVSRSPSQPASPRPSGPKKASRR